MRDNIAKLKNAVDELEQELNQLSSVDGEDRDVLERALKEINSVLHAYQNEQLEPASMMERLNEAALEFEESHPTISGVISRLIDGLGQMGI